MRIVVTGTAGMVGSVLAEALLDAGHEVLGFDRAPNPWSARVEAVTRRVDARSDPVDWPRAPGIDAVVHLAANARVHELVIEPARARENVDTTFHALEYARVTGARFVFASSREVYGNRGRKRYAEGDVSAEVVESPYAASKLAGEALVRSYGRVYTLPWTVLRLSNVYGRNDLTARFIPTAFRCALERRPLTVYGRKKRLDFTYIDDAVGGILAVLDRPKAAEAQVFNIASGRAHTLIEAAGAVSRALDRPLPLRVEESRPGEVTAYEADITRARRLLGYAPRAGLDEGMRLAAAWYARYIGPPPVPRHTATLPQRPGR